MATAASYRATEDLALRRSWALALPWFVWTSIAAVTSACVGLHWDISWHRSIGRDTFWTPAHIAIQFSGLLAGVVSAWLIFSASFRASAEARSASVQVWGLRGPLGAFVCAWGGLAMVFSAPFDNWWHEAYGLDVKIISPPHVVLALGIFAVAFGSLLLISAAMNRAEASERNALEWSYVYVSGMIFALMQVLIMEYLWLVAKHTAEPYIVLAIASPALLAGTAFSMERRFAATAVAAIFTALVLGLTLVLPLFPAEPKLGPVYQSVTHFVPPPFPPLVIVPALALDLLWSKTRHWNRWTISVLSGIVFSALMWLADWNMATFILQSRLGQARFFHLGYVDYNVPLTANSFYMRHMFWPEPLNALLSGILFATVIAILSSRLGIARGDWTRRVQR